LARALVSIVHSEEEQQESHKHDVQEICRRNDEPVFDVKTAVANGDNASLEEGKRVRIFDRGRDDTTPRGNGFVLG